MQGVRRSSTVISNNSVWKIHNSWRKQYKANKMRERWRERGGHTSYGVSDDITFQTYLYRTNSDKAAAAGSLWNFRGWFKYLLKITDIVGTWKLTARLRLQFRWNAKAHKLKTCISKTGTKSTLVTLNFSSTLRIL